MSRYRRLPNVVRIGVRPRRVVAFQMTARRVLTVGVVCRWVVGNPKECFLRVLFGRYLSGGEVVQPINEVLSRICLSISRIGGKGRVESCNGIGCTVLVEGDAGFGVRAKCLA